MRKPTSWKVLKSILVLSTFMDSLNNSFKYFSPLLDESSLSGVRRGSSGSAFSHLKSSRAASKEDLNSSPSRNFDPKNSSTDKLVDSAAKESPGKLLCTYCLQIWNLKSILSSDFFWSVLSTHFHFFFFFCLGAKPTDSKTKIGSGLSCLMSSTTDEDLPVLPKSPEKRSLLSPSVNSISEIFAKSASAKFTASASGKKEEKSPFSEKGVSPFTGRKTTEEHRRSVLSSEESANETPAKILSPGKVESKMRSKSFSVKLGWINFYWTNCQIPLI